MPQGYRLERGWYQLRLRLRSLLRRRRIEQELDDEVGYHLDQLVERNLAAGMTPHDARHAAVRTFGGVTQRMEECRDMRGLRWVDDLSRDVRHALRLVRRSPGFAAAAIVTLALGIGGTVAVFTVVSNVLLQPLPYPNPERLFLISHAQLSSFMPRPSLSDRDYLTFRAHDRSFQSIAAYSTYPANLLTPTEPARITVGQVTADFFRTLEVDAAIGRTFSAADERQPEDVLVLSHDLWRTRMGADPGIVGKIVALNGRNRAVIGVMPREFRFPDAAQAWSLYVVRETPGQTWNTPVIGRLRADVPETSAHVQFAAIASQFKVKAAPGWTSGLLPLKEVVVGDVRRPFAMFGGAVAVVLLIACANVASLQLARASVRQRELAVRAAMGAGRGRIVRQLLTESLLLSLVGGVGGIALAAWGVPTLLSLAPEGRIPRIESVRLNAWVLLFALAVSIATGVLFGLVPAVRLARQRPAGSLAPGMRTQNRENERLRGALVVAEIALSLMLLTAAALLAQSFLRVRNVDSGFSGQNVLTQTIDLPTSSYGSAAKMHRFNEDLLERLSRLPDVTRAAAVNWRPLGRMLISGDFVSESATIPTDFQVDKMAVSPGYFEVMGISIREGRDFTAGDRAERQPVAIISQSVARVLDPSGRALGQRISVSSRPQPGDWMVIIGIVEDVRHEGPSQPLHAAIYRPYLQVGQPFFLDHMTFLARTSGDPLTLAPAMRDAVHAVDRTLPAETMITMESALEAATAEWRFNARLIGSFAVVALILTVIGTYSVLTYSVAQRTQEIGVRMALGAGRRSVRWLVVRRTLALSVLGVAIGTAAALGTTRLLATLLFDITPTDAPTFVAVAATILVAAVAASYVPARRATRVDPLLALRHE